MTSFAQQVLQLRSSPPDLFKHVNYIQGMVLGVADLRQEFAYHANRSQWLARDLLGYGTLSGLKVSIETTQKGPQVVVEPGVALSPRGQFIRVPDACCALLNDWLQLPENHSQLNMLPGSPQTDQLQLQVVLCYSDVATDKVPIPGEPCRSEDDLQADSRLQDCFSLDLRPTVANPHPPDQSDYEVTRLFAELLSQVQVTTDPTQFLTLTQFEQAILDMGATLKATLSGLPDSPPTSPPVFTTGSPATTLHIPAGQVGDYLRSALRIWVTDLRPQWQPNGPGQPPDEECVLLADLFLAVKHDPLRDQWLVDGTVLVDETHRPYLVHTNLLQELLFAGVPGGPGQGSSGPLQVAAGRFDAAGVTRFSSNGLAVRRLTTTRPQLYLLNGPWFTPTGNYIVKGHAVVALNNATTYSIEVVDAADAQLAPVLSPLGLTPKSGIVVRVMQSDNQVVGAGLTGLLFEINRYL